MDCHCMRCYEGSTEMAAVNVTLAANAFFFKKVFYAHFLSILRVLRDANQTFLPLSSISNVPTVRVQSLECAV